MGSPKTVLLVCRDLSEIHLLPHVRLQPDRRYIVASDDSRVHLEMAKYPWVAEVCYIEQMESFYAVAPDVIKYLKLINQWLESLDDDPKGIPRELLFWIRHCEGGMTTQRLQDVLLLIRSYQALLEAHDISRVVIFSHPRWQWEDDVLVKAGQSKGIKISISGGWRAGVLKARLWSLVKFIVRDPYYLADFLRAKLCGYGSSDKPGVFGKEIVMQLCSDEPRHVGNILPLMKALKDRGYETMALLWRASAAGEQFRRVGVRAEELETYAPISALWEPMFRVWRTWRRARHRRREFFAHPGLKYRNISLGPLLWPSVRSFVWEELAQRFRFQQAARKYFAGHHPKALRVWGGGALPEGAMVLKSLQKNNRPLIFFWIMNFFDNPYDSDMDFIDLFFAAGDCQKHYLEKIGVPSRRIVSVGLSRYDHLAAFRKEFSPAHSRKYLNLPADFQTYLLFDANSTSRGYITIQEQSLVTKALLSFAWEHPTVALIIKPHPAHRPGGLEALIDYFSLPNVFLIDKNMMPYHALNAADLLITKFSTIALEAMLFKRPVVSILLDEEERFRIYDDAVERVNSVEALNEILTMMVSDTSRRTAWVENQLRNQAGFLKHYFGDSMAESAQIGAEALDNFLKDYQPNEQFNE